jgi:WhiB family redox-sensing transcriptional regulator
MVALRHGSSRRPAPGEEPALADLFGITRPPAWTADALCAQGHPDAWHPERDDPNGAANAAVARRVCHRCPVRTECLAHALLNDEREGIWGGTTPNQRKAIRRANQSTTSAASPTPDETAGRAAAA